MAKRNKKEQYMYHLKKANYYMNEIKKCDHNNRKRFEMMKKKMAKHVERAKKLAPELET